MVETSYPGDMKSDTGLSGLSAAPQNDASLADSCWSTICWNESLESADQDSTRLNSFSTRKDVVNKVLLRSLKRYYTNLFHKETGFNNMTKRAKKRNFVELVDEFMANRNLGILDHWNYQRDLNHKSVTADHVQQYISFLISPELWKRTRDPSPYLSMFDTY